MKGTRVQLGIVAASCLALLGLAVASPAHALGYKTQAFVMSASQEVPPNGSTGTGNGDIVVDTGAKTITYTVNYSGLTGPPTAAHFHGPALPGTNAAVKIGLTVTASPLTGTVAYNPADEADILSGKWYVNIHTSVNPGGEIRGQVNLIAVPATGTWTLVVLLALLAGAGAFFLLRRRRTALA